MGSRDPFETQARKAICASCEGEMQFVESFLGEGETKRQNARRRERAGAGPERRREKRLWAIRATW